MRVTRTSSSPIALLVAVLVLLAAAAPALATSFPLTVTNLAIAPVEGQVFSGPLAVVADPNGLHTAGEYSGSIEWGDGTTDSATIIVSGSAISIVGTHTYIQTGPTVLKVSVANSGEPASGSAETTIDVADAPLTPNFTAPTLFSGAGPGAASASLSAFQAAIGGIDNGAIAGEQSGGLRHINWDAVKLDGTQPESLTISAGHTVAVPVGSQQERGIELGAPIAVSGDGFATVNASAAGLFAAFSASNLAAPFDTNTIVLNVVAPAAPGAVPVPAATRALGVAFLNVRLPNTTSIEYRNGQATLAKVFAPVAPAGKPSFAGALFEAPLVTSVLITLGSARIFSFDGSNTLPNFSGEGGAENMVAADDIVLAEPAREGPTLSSTAGVPLSGTLASFQDPDPNATIHYYSATIDWGDGTRGPGTIAPASGGGAGYTVSASHTYSHAGTLPIAVTIHDLGGAQAVLHATALVNPAALIVSPPPLPTPPAPAPPPPLHCTLAVGSSALARAYLGAGAETTAPAAAAAKARHPKATPHNHLRATARCDQDAVVTLTALATIAGGGRHAHKARATLTSLALAHTSAHLTANRPAALRLTLSPATLSKLRTAAGRHDGISVKLTLAASSAHGTATATAVVSSLKL
jgi:hypothetical protein